MTKREAVRQTEQENMLLSLGFTREEAEQLRRISMTLHRWHELECGDSNQYGTSFCVVRGMKKDGEFQYDENGQAYLEISGVSGPNRYRRIPDRETGAKKRLEAIIRARNLRVSDVDLISGGVLRYYIQTDPRGAALYILRPGDVPEGKEAGSYYNRGLCIF